MIFYSRIANRKVVSMLKGQDIIVLAALTDNVRLTDEPKRALQRVSEHSYDAWPWLQSHYVFYAGGREISFIPLYEVGEEPYTVYCDSVKLV